MLFKISKTRLSHEEIKAWLIDLRGKPFNTSSNFDVTAVFRVQLNNDDNHYYFAGVNVENKHLRLSTHAEEGAISAMATAFGKSAVIVEGWVMGSPRALTPNSDQELANIKVTCCGKCRQQIVGFAKPEAVIHSVSLNGEFEQTTVAEFLPKAFSFRDFAPDQLQPSLLNLGTLTPEKIQNRLVREGILTQTQILEWLKSLESVDHATKEGHAVVLRLTDNRYVAGVSIEEAAYVSIEPIASAIANARAHYGQFKVEEVWSLSANSLAVNTNIPSNAAATAMTFQFDRQGQQPQPAAQSFTPLPLSSFQVLDQFAVDRNIRVNYMNRAGIAHPASFSEALQLSVCLPAEPNTKPSVEPDCGKLNKLSNV